MVRRACVVGAVNGRDALARTPKAGPRQAATAALVSGAQCTGYLLVWPLLHDIEDRCHQECDEVCLGGRAVH